MRFDRPDGKREHISFCNLVEAHVLRALRTAQGVALTELRTAIAYAEKELNNEIPGAGERNFR